MDIMQLYVIQNRFIFVDNEKFWYLVIPLNNFTSMNNCLCVQGKWNKPPPPPELCVCWGGGNSYSMILPLFLLSYANYIILLYDYWMKGLVKLHH